ncbi:MAG: serine/threonine protein kinase [Candidatus Sumerlaeia bacterium]|nr:serine/threonine protein kinase [Candidatus Sumerlaeia bacterium]
MVSPDPDQPDNSQDKNKKVHPPSEARIPLARDEGDVSRPSIDPTQWVGNYLGPYMVERVLAKGGMGVVLLGKDETLRRKVAIKIMSMELMADGDSVKRFEREARATASVQHPAIAQIYLVGLSEEGTPFMAMEFLEGGSLRDLIKSQKRVTYIVAATWMEQIADALRAAGKANIIHRDIKPANIMITAKGDVKVVDFGLAKIFFEDSYRTQEGSVLGTPSYMAPEQSQGRSVDFRADIYSLGATMYHLLTGRTPFEGESPVQIMMKHVTAPLVPMKTLVSSIPVEFDDIVSRCMRKDMDERYQDYESLLYDIKQLRLMLTAREQGSMFTGGEKKGGGVTQAGTTILPPPPSSILRPGAKATPPESPMELSALAGNQSAIDRDASSVGPIPLLLGAAAGVVLLIGLVTYLTGSPKENFRGEDRPVLSVWLEKAAQQARLLREGDGEDFDLDYLSYLATMESLENLRVGIVNHELANGEYPRRVQDFAREDRVLISFDLNDSGEPLDGWGNPIRYETRTYTLKSAGLDGSYDTSVDLVMHTDGTIEIPTVYQRLEGSD